MHTTLYECECDVRHERHTDWRQSEASGAQCQTKKVRNREICIQHAIELLDIMLLTFEDTGDRSWFTPPVEVGAVVVPHHWMRQTSTRCFPTIDQSQSGFRISQASPLRKYIRRNPCSALTAQDQFLDVILLDQTCNDADYWRPWVLLLFGP